MSAYDDFQRSGRDSLSMFDASPPDNVFREYDVRGLVDAPFDVDPGRLNEYSANRLGRAFGAYLAEHGVGHVVVGYDSRAYSPLLAGQFQLGLLAAGCDVTSIGLATTPMVYFAQHHLEIEGAVSVTASHNPNGWGGMKLSAAPSTTLGPTEVAELHRHATESPVTGGRGVFTEVDVVDAYLDSLVSKRDAVRPLKIAVDGANSVSGSLAAAALRAAGHEVVEVNADLDWTFPNHEPDPELVEGRIQIAAAVRESSADAGFSFDGDGDRLGVTDDKGETVWSDRVLALLARRVLELHPGAEIVYDVKCSRLVADVITDLGGTPHMWMTGHSHIKSEMQRRGSPFGGERSGHFFNAFDSHGYDDAIDAALLLAEIVAGSGRSISELVGALPHYVTSPTMQADCPDAEKYAVVERLTAAAQRLDGCREVVTVNGARLEYDDGWLLVRASSNVPALVIVCEGSDEAELRRLYDVARALLADEPSVARVWTNDPFVEVTGGDAAP